MPQLPLLSASSTSSFLGNGGGGGGINLASLAGATGLGFRPRGGILSSLALKQPLRMMMPTGGSGGGVTTSAVSGLLRTLGSVDVVATADGVSLTDDENGQADVDVDANKDIDDFPPFPLHRLTPHGTTSTLSHLITPPPPVTTAAGLGGGGGGGSGSTYAIQSLDHEAQAFPTFAPPNTILGHGIGSSIGNGEGDVDDDIFSRN